MLAEPELGESADPRALVRGDPAAVRATAEHLAALAAGCAATARGLDAIGVRGWSGAAAAAFRERHAELSARWSRAAAAFRSAAQAWERFGIELGGGQEQAAAAAARFRRRAVRRGAALAVGLRGGACGLADLVRRLWTGGRPEHGPDLDAARRMLAEARARRDRAAVAAAREIAAAAALAPDPPGDGDRRALAAADWVRANGVALGHVARGVGEGVEDVVRFARLVNPADPYNLNHPGRFVANASTALAGAVDDVVHPAAPGGGVRRARVGLRPGAGVRPPAAHRAADGGRRVRAARPSGGRAPDLLRRRSVRRPAPLWPTPDRPPAPSRPLHHPPPPCPLRATACRLPAPARSRPIRLHPSESRLRRHRSAAPDGSHRRRRCGRSVRASPLPPSPPTPSAGPRRVGWPMRPRPSAAASAATSSAATGPPRPTGSATARLGAGGRGGRGGRRRRGRATGGDRAPPAVGPGEADAQGRRGAGPAPRPRARPPRPRDQGRQGLHQHPGQPGQPQVAPRRARAPRAREPGGRRRRSSSTSSAAAPAPRTTARTRRSPRRAPARRSTSAAP